MNPPRARALLGVWLLILLALGWFVQCHLRVAADLRLFLPEPQTAEQKLLLEEIGEGPASRLLIIALTGAEPPVLAEISQSLSSELKNSEVVRFVANGSNSIEALPEQLLAYRYLLSDSFDARPLDTAYLTSELQQREFDISSPAASFIEPLLARDPTLETLKLIERLQPAREPRREFDVWFTQDGTTALLLVETRAAAFDPQGQAEALTTIRRMFDRARQNTAAHLEISGPGAFSALMQSKTAGEGQRFGVIATIGMILLVLIAYRRFGAVMLSALPLASAGIVGMFAVSAVFGTVHGITLAFGFTLIGVAQDYPIHLLSHQHQGESPLHSARALWPTLATGVASTCVAYLAFYFSGVPGLAQLATFTVTGLAVAGLTTRFILPRLLLTTDRDVAQQPSLQRLHAVLAHVSIPRWVAALLLVGALGILWAAPGPMWQNDLGSLTPVPTELLVRDQALRRELGTSDVRYSLAVSAADAEQALQRLEALGSRLTNLQQSGAIVGFQHAAHYLPSARTQLERRTRLPDEAALQSALADAVAPTAFEPAAFDDFLQDVRTARQSPPLTVDMLAGTPLATQLGSLLLTREDHTIALVALAGVKDVAALRTFAANGGGDVHLLDLKEATESLVAQQRTHMLWSLAVAAVLLIAVVVIALRHLSRVLRVLAPMALTTVGILAILHGSGVSLSLFHLISLVLAAGLGLDYALFFERAADDVHEQRRTLHAIVVCSLSTLMVFALLSLSSMPVLRAIGVTVSLGVISNFVLALVLTRPRVAEAA